MLKSSTNFIIIKRKEEIINQTLNDIVKNGKKSRASENRRFYRKNR